MKHKKRRSAKQIAQFTANEIRLNVGLYSTEKALIADMVLWAILEDRRQRRGKRK